MSGDRQSVVGFPGLLIEVHQDLGHVAANVLVSPDRQFIHRVEDDQVERVFAGEVEDLLGHCFDLEIFVSFSFERPGGSVAPPLV